MVATAVAGTGVIAAGAFWLSFTALADLAHRSGIGADQAWAWPLIVDGIIVVATVSVVALAGQASAWYPWLLLFAATGISVGANAIHATLNADTSVPPMLAGMVAAVPPLVLLVLLAITHLTVVLTHPTTTAAETATVNQPANASAPDEEAKPATASTALVPAGGSVRQVAAVLRGRGWSNKAIAHHLGVHPSTVGRWFTPRQVEGRREPDQEHELDQEREGGPS